MDEACCQQKHCRDHHRHTGNGHGQRRPGQKQILRGICHVPSKLLFHTGDQAADPADRVPESLRISHDKVDQKANTGCCRIFHPKLC